MAPYEHEITSVLQETRLFPPPPNFASSALVSDAKTYDSLWAASVENPDKFWGDQAVKELRWHVPFSTVRRGEAHNARWFVDGKLNVSFNCLDRHLEQRGDKTALIWEGEPGDKRRLTYRQLWQDVCQLAGFLKSQGIQAGDTVSIYMPMIPESAVAVLACARIGAVHNVVFAGFSAEALAERNRDSEAKMIITADGLYRRGQVVNLKEQVDKSLESTPSVKRVLVYNRTNAPLTLDPKRDMLWQDVVPKATPLTEVEAFDAEHPLFLLYTSGSTGKPKGLVHTSAGYLLGVTVSTKYVFDLKEEDIYWCTADIGWVTGHSYVVYGPLSSGATVFMYEGAPNHPGPDRFWRMIDDNKITILYTAPTAIRSFMKWGDEHPGHYKLDSLRLLGSVGEPINPEAWLWYHETIGRKRCPIVDTWWQTETGSIMISPLPGATSTLPGSATKPFFGIEADVVDDKGRSLPPNKGGYLVIRKPWPSMTRGIHKDPERYKNLYWEKIPGIYFTGDGARRDEHGNFWIMGRVDDVLNVSGHRLSTMEIESALVQHPSVAEAAVVGKPDAVKGESITCFVSLRGTAPSAPLKDELKAHVTSAIGALARPDEIRFTDALPKTRSGKIMRRLLRNIAKGERVQGDISTLEDFSVVARLHDEED